MLLFSLHQRYIHRLGSKSLLTTVFYLRKRVAAASYRRVKSFSLMPQVHVEVVCQMHLSFLQFCPYLPPL